LAGCYIFTVTESSSYPVLYRDPGEAEKRGDDKHGGLLMKGSYLVAIVVAASIAMLGSCGGKGGKAGDILAEVNGEPVTAAQMNKEIEKLPVTQRTSFLSPAGKKDFLEALIRKKVILQSALKSGLGDDPGIREQVEDSGTG
jgi:hypothetical protein